MSRSHPVLQSRRLPLTAAASATLALLLGVLGAPPPAVAESDHAKLGTTVTGSATDPVDTDGRLDITRVQDRVVQVDRSHFYVTYTVRTRTPFGSNRLDTFDRNFVIELNRDAESGSERNVRIAYRDGVLVAEVISNATRRVIATVKVSRPSEQSIQITGPRRLVGARSYFWTSNFHAPRSHRCGFGDGFPIVCQDSVPQRGWLRLQAPAWPAVS